MIQSINPKIKIILLIMFFCFWELSSTTVWGIEVGGPQAGVWTLEGSPYIVTSDIIVPTGMTLKIEPGIVVKFDGYYGITVNGTLIAEGIVGKRIVLTSIHDKEFGNTARQTNSMPTNKDWKGIEFTAASRQTSKLDVCIIRYCDQAIAADFANPYLSRLFLVDCSATSFKVNGRTITVQEGAEIDYNIVQTPFIQNPVLMTTPPAVLPQQKQAPTTFVTNTSKPVVQSLFAEEEFTFGEMKVISAAKIAQRPEEAPASIYVITQKEIEENGWTSVDEILNYIPGFESMITVGSDRLYNVRGIGSPFNSRILFMIDGVSVADAFHGGMSRSAKSFSFANIDRIEVISGPGSALYGTGAFSGIVNIIMKEPQKSGFGLSACGGNGGMLGTYSYASYKNTNIGLHLYGNYREDDGLQRPYDAYTTDEHDIIDPQKMQYFGGKINFLKYLSFNLNYGKHTRIDGIGLNFPHAAQDMEVYGEYQNFSLNANFPVHNRAQVNSLVYYRKANWVGEGDVLSPEQLAVHPKFKNAYAAGKYPNGGYFQALRRTSLRGFDIYTNIHATESVEILFGFAAELTDVSDMKMGVLSNPVLPQVPTLSDQRNHDLTTSVLLDSTENRVMYAGYAQATINIQKFSFILGRRSDRYSDIGGTLNPRMGIVFRPNNKFILKLLSGQAFRAPAIRDLYAYGPGIPVSGNRAFADSSWYEPLRPEISQTYELISIIKPTSSIQIEFSGSYIEISDIIFENTTTPIAIYNNASEATSIGASVAIRSNISSKFKVYSNLSYFQTKTTDIPIKDNSEDGQSTLTIENMLMSPILFNIWGNYDITSKIKFAFGLNYRSSKTRGLYAKQGLDLKDPRKDVPAYTLVNLNLLIQNFINRISLNLGVKDLFDTKHLDPGPYPLPSASSNEAGDIPNRGRILYASLKYKL